MTFAYIFILQCYAVFKFGDYSQDDHTSSFFSNLFESYRRRYDEFHPVQDLRNMVEKAAGDKLQSVSSFRDIIEKAAGDKMHTVNSFRNMVMETAQNMTERANTLAETETGQRATKMYESLVHTGEMVDKQLHATYDQLHQVWDSVNPMKQRRLDTARKLAKQRKQLQQQLKGYRVMLERMREMSSGVPSKQMAALMQRITECYRQLDYLETHAQDAFVHMTGLTMTMPFQRKEPQRFAKYSSDPLNGIATYPLCLHVLLLGGTEIPLRIMMRRRGFERRQVGPVSYYFHPGSSDEELDPLVFVHGIGIGLLTYVPLIDGLLQTKRPIYLPEIPYVCGFRPWQSSDAVLQPSVVTSTMVAMLASHGHLHAGWMGHSYGTSWLSSVLQSAPETVRAALFLDPIPFLLHAPRLTKQFVYTQPDPSAISYILRTDLMVNRTIQRSFPWSKISLFAEDIHVPCGIVLSEQDLLVPAAKIERYTANLGAVVQDFEDVRQELLQDKRQDACSARHPHLECTLIRGDGHGDWTERPSETTPVLVYMMESLLRKANKDKSQ